MKTLEDLRVGDVVWRDDVNRRGRPLSQTTVTKIGSKLITVALCDEKFRKDTLRTNDGYGHGKLIIDLEAYDQEAKRQALFMKIKQSFGYQPQHNYHTLQAVAAMLGIEE